MAKRKSAPKEKSSNRTVSGCLVALSVIVIVALFGGGGKGKPSSAQPTTGITLYAPTPVTEVARQAPASTATYTDANLVIYDKVLKLTLNEDTDAYECPMVRCAVIAQLRANIFVYVDGETSGQFKNGSEKWYRSFFGSATIYIPSGAFTEAQAVAVAATATITDTPAPESGVESDGSLFRYAQVRTMYVNKSNSVNARSCPRTTCSIVTRLGGFSAIPVEGEITGELVTNNTLWYQVTISGQTAYIHSSLLSTEKPATGVPRPTQPPIQFVATMPPGVVVSTPVPIQVIQPPPVNSGFVPICTGDVYNCGDLTCDQLAAYIATCSGDPSDLDGNEDKRFCESKNC